MFLLCLFLSKFFLRLPFPRTSGNWLLFPTEFDCSRGWGYKQRTPPTMAFCRALNNVYCAPLKIKKGSTHSSAKSIEKPVQIYLLCVCVCVCLHPSVPATNNNERIDSNFSLDILCSHGWMDPSYPFFFFFSPSHRAALDLKTKTRRTPESYRAYRKERTHV